jgi:hypothetical protein
LDLIDVPKPSKTWLLTGTSTCFTYIEAGDRHSQWAKNKAEPVLQSKPILLAGYGDPMLTLSWRVKVSAFTYLLIMLIVLFNDVAQYYREVLLTASATGSVPVQYEWISFPGINLVMSPPPEYGTRSVSGHCSC